MPAKRKSDTLDDEKENPASAGPSKVARKATTIADIVLDGEEEVRLSRRIRYLILNTHTLLFQDEVPILYDAFLFFLPLPLTIVPRLPKRRLQRSPTQDSCLGENSRLQGKDAFVLFFYISSPPLQITHWLKDLGNVNSNSYRQFSTLSVPFLQHRLISILVKMSGPNAGAGNRLYYHASVAPSSSLSQFLADHRLLTGMSTSRKSGSWKAKRRHPSV